MKTGNSYKRLQNTSRFISLILRHRPEAVGITIDEHGWADVREMIDGVNKSGKHTLNMEMLEEIVRTDEKQRYSFNEDHTLIRANQGHSIPVDVEPEEKIPPDILWHGTGEKYVSSIDAQGLIPKGRGKSADGTGSRSFMRSTAGEWQETDTAFSFPRIRYGLQRKFRPDI